jgi:hypothetical protein
MSNAEPKPRLLKVIPKHIDCSPMARRTRTLKRKTTRRLLLATTLAVAALAPPSHATEIGNIISFTAPTIGCTNFADSRETLRLRTLYGNAAAGNFALQIQDFVGGRACAIFNNPHDEWKIVDKAKTQYTGPNESYFCVESTIDYIVSSPAERAARKEPPKPLPCFWVFLSEHHH